MKVHYGLDDFGPVSRPVVTTGTFDGVHIGHQTIIDRLRELAQKIEGETVLITFHPHPRMILYPDDHGLSLLNTQKEKITLLDKAGIDHLVILTFTKAFSRTTSVEYVRDILVNKIGTNKLVIGYNHHFGRNREGSFEHLMEYGHLYGFEVEEIPAQDIDSVNVSSTKIRNALGEGDVGTANSYLDYSYELTGTVIPGNRLGRTIGFPTANLELDDPHKLVPADGVYAVRVDYRGRPLNGMLNIGVKPTITDSGTRSLEVHLFDFDQDIYGEELTIRMKGRIRDERRFDNLEGLKQQLHEDKARSLSMLV